MKNKAILLLLVATSSLLLPCDGTPAFSEQLKATKTADEFTIQLNTEGGTRWKEVIKKYEAAIKNVIDIIKKKNPGLDKIFEVIDENNIQNSVGSPYKEEMVGIAKQLGVDVGDIVMINTYYEIANAFFLSKNASIACTSIVANTETGILHGRNLDYYLKPHLTDMVITVIFKKGEEIKYVGSTFAGYIGILTGLKPKEYTISINERYAGKTGIFDWLTKLDNSIAFSIRSLLSKDGKKFADAVEHMKTTKLIAATYVIIGGVAKGEGAVITRGKTATAHVDEIDAGWYVVQTNDDHWTGKTSDNRYDKAKEFLTDDCGTEATPECLNKVMSTDPVEQKDATIYTVVMSAAAPEDYKTLVL